MRLDLLGERIRADRESVGYTLPQAAEVTGIPADRLEQIESGQAEPDIAEARTLARTYGSSLDRWAAGLVDLPGDLPGEAYQGLSAAPSALDGSVGGESSAASGSERSRRPQSLRPRSRWRRAGSSLLAASLAVALFCSGYVAHGWNGERSDLLEHGHALDILIDSTESVSRRQNAVGRLFAITKTWVLHARDVADAPHCPPELRRHIRAYVKWVGELPTRERPEYWVERPR
jgi:transcriptional regulator with XRE-family HTH domain